MPSCLCCLHATARTQTYTLSLHDALPIYGLAGGAIVVGLGPVLSARSFARTGADHVQVRQRATDRKSTRLNSSHRCISYAVFCLKKQKKMQSPAAIPTTNAPGATDRSAAP